MVNVRKDRAPGTRHTAFTCFFLEPLEPRLLLAAEQIVTANPAVSAVEPSAAFSIDAIYSTSDNNDTLSGLGLRLHFDSTKLAFNSLSQLLATSLFSQSQAPQDDAGDLDNDPATNKLIFVIWADFATNWPGPGSLPATLFAANFTAAADFSQPTAVNFTAIETAAGYSFNSQSAVVNVAVPNQPPTVTNPVTDLDVAEDAAAVLSHADLNDVFDDSDHTDSQLQYTISANSPTGIVAASINGTTDSLDLSFLANQNGQSNITVRATDPAGDFVETTFTVTVNPVNDAPTTSATIGNVLVTDGSGPTNIGLASAYSDVDIATNADSLTFTVFTNTNPIVATPTINGNLLTLTYTPGQIGSTDMTVRATDQSGAFAQQTFTVSVIAAPNNEPPNNPPFVANPVADVAVDENDPDTTLNLATTFDDPDIATGDVLQLTVTDNTKPSVVGADLDGTDLTLTYLPDQNGSARITVRATDLDGKFIEDTFNVIVTAAPENQAPFVANPISDLTILEDLLLSLVHANLNDVFDDPDNTDSELDYTIAANTAEQLIAADISDDDALELNFSPNESGSANITIRATDPNDNSIEQTFTITILADNDPPFVAGAILDVTVPFAASGSNTVVDLAGAFDDIDDEALALSVADNTNPFLVNATINAQTLTLAYAPAQHGSVELTIRAMDQSQAFAQQSVAVTIEPPLLPDLVVTALAAPATAVVPGESASFTFTVANQGSQTVIGGFDLQLFVTNAIAPPVHGVFPAPDLALLPAVTLVTPLIDTPLGPTITQNIDIAAGQSQTFTVDVPIEPSADFVGPFTVHGVLDPNDVIPENDEDNNTFATTIFADQLIPLGPDRQTSKLIHMSESGEKITVLIRKSAGYAVVKRYAGNTPDIRRIELTISEPKTSLKINNKGPASIGRVVSRWLKDLTAKKMTLIGGVDVLESLNSMRIGNISDGARIVAAGAAAKGTKLRAERIGNVVFELAGMVKSFRAIEFTNGMLHADVLNSLVIKGKRNVAAGDMGADLVLTGLGAAKATLGKAKITGGLINAQWRIAGMGVRSLAVKGAATDSDIRSTNTIRSATFGHLIDTNLFAAVNDDVVDLLDFQAANFNAPAEIVRLTIKGLMQNANIAAPHLGKVKLADVVFNNGGTDFGLITDSYGSFRRNGGGTLVLPLGGIGEVERDDDYIFKLV